MPNSNNKGKRGEREFAKFLRDAGYEARRAQQYSGTGEDLHSADLVDNIENARGEIKRGYNNDELYGKVVSDWVDKIEEDTPNDCWWYIAWRKDRKKWILIYKDPYSSIISHTHDVIKQLKYLEEHYLHPKI